MKALILEQIVNHKDGHWQCLQLCVRCALGMRRLAAVRGSDCAHGALYSTGATGLVQATSLLGQKQLQQLEEMCGSAGPGNTCPGSTSTSIMGHDSGVLEFLSLSLCSFFQLVGSSRPENDQQQYERELGPRQQTTVAHHQRRPPTAHEATALTPTCDLLLAAMGPDIGRSQSGEFGTSSNTQCGEGSR